MQDVRRHDLAVQPEADAAVAAAREFLHLDHRIQLVGPGATVLLGHGHAQEAVRAGLVPHRTVDEALLLPRVVVRRDLAFHEPAEAVAESLVVRAEQGAFDHRHPFACAAQALRRGAAGGRCRPDDRASDRADEYTAPGIPGPRHAPGPARGTTVNRGEDDHDDRSLCVRRHPHPAGQGQAGRQPLRSQAGQPAGRRAGRTAAPQRPGHLAGRRRRDGRRLSGRRTGLRHREGGGAQGRLGLALRRRAAQSLLRVRTRGRQHGRAEGPLGVGGPGGRRRR